MKNIYDIISEQKAITDINIASYDLTYTINHISNNSEEYYLQEGLGDTVKNTAKKIIEFIKSLIAKIKELIKKVVNWIFGRKDRLEEMNAEIAEANGDEVVGSDDGSIEYRSRAQRRKDEKNKKKEEKHRAKEEKKEEKHRMKEEKKEEKHRAKEEKKEEKKNVKAARKKAKDINEVLRISNSQVNIRYFSPLNNKIELTSIFFSNMDRTVQELGNDNISDDIITTNVIHKTFKKQSNDNSIGKKIELEIGEDKHEPQTYQISAIADIIMGYLEKANDSVKYLHVQEKRSTDALNKLIKFLERNDKPDKNINLSRTAATMISEFVNVICQSITRAYSASLQIAEKAKRDYIDSVKNH